MQVIYEMRIGTYQITGLNSIYLGYITQNNLFLCFVPPHIFAYLDDVAVSPRERERLLV